MAVVSSAMSFRATTVDPALALPSQPFHLSAQPIRTAGGTVTRVARIFDAVCALTVLLVIYTLLNSGRMPGELQEFLAIRLSIKNVVVAVLVLAIWHTAFAAFGLYDLHRLRSFRASAIRIVLASSVAAWCFLPFVMFSRSGLFDVEVVVVFWLVGTAVELLGRGSIAAGVRYLARTSRDIRLVVIVGSGPRALRLWRTLQSRDPRDHVVARFVDTRAPGDVAPEIAPHVIGTLEELEIVLSREPVDQVFIALPVKSCYAAIQRALDACERVGVEANYFPDIFPVSRARGTLDENDEIPVVRLTQVTDDRRILVKRLIDVAGAAAGLIALSPVLLACAVAIKLTSPGPVVFSQVRYGFNRRRFRMHKFRTMVQHAERLQASLEDRNEAAGPVFKIKADPRITPVGRFLRKTSLDELPQLWNVLMGEMSLVGPRPLAVRDVLRFEAGWRMRRFSVKPGLTCLWQINGRSAVDFERWVQLDLEYIDNWSLSLDLRILVRTVPAVLSGTGAM